MGRASEMRGRLAAIRLIDQAGFTLIELLVAMVIGVIVLAGGTYGLALAFNQSSEVTSRTASTNQAEVGLEQLSRDLRFATPCPSYNNANTLGSGGQSVSGVLVSTGPKLQMCDPVAGTHSSQPDAIALISWTCNTATGVESCTRSATAVLCPTASSGTAPATANCILGAPTLATAVTASVPIDGVSAANISGLVAGVNQSSLLSDSTCQVVSGVESYGLSTGTTCPLSWVHIGLTIATLSDPGSPGDSADTLLGQKVAPIQLQSATALRNGP